MYFPWSKLVSCVTVTESTRNLLIFVKRLQKYTFVESSVRTVALLSSYFSLKKFNGRIKQEINFEGWSVF